MHSEIASLVHGQARPVAATTTYVCARYVAHHIGRWALRQVSHCHSAEVIFIRYILCHYHIAVYILLPAVVMR